MNNSNPVITIFASIVVAGMIIYGAFYIGAVIAYIPFSWAMRAVNSFVETPIIFLHEEIREAVERDLQVAYRLENTVSGLRLSVSARNPTIFPIKSLNPECKVYFRDGTETRLQFDFTASRTSLRDHDKIDISIPAHGALRYSIPVTGMVGTNFYQDYCTFWPSVHWWIWASEIPQPLER